MPLALDDDAMQAVMDASTPLPRACRSDFLQAMAAELTAHPVASPAELRKVIREVQGRTGRRHEATAGGYSKYR
jgi:hypothetical protein